MEDRIPGLLVLLLLHTACVPEQVLTEHRRERSTNGICRYGNKVDCCWGWTRESWGQCRPVCESGCKHGECVGPDQCRCHQGYTGKTCNQDVNECGLKPRPCKHRCVNLVGSYKCFCLTGYMMTPDDTCRNARTCGMANCQYGCAVMKGVVVCQCPSPGLQLGPDRRTCVDIDECAMGVAKCPRFRKCVNTFGSYICKCHRGFELRYINGKYQCTDKNNPCHENPDSKKCRCKPGTRGWGYDCKIVITVAVDPARPSTTHKPTTKITTAMLPPATKTPARATTAMTTAQTTTTSPSTTTTTTTMPTTVTTTTNALATVAMTTTTTMTASPMTSTTTTIIPATVTTTTPTTVTTTPTTVSKTTTPTTVTTTTTTTTVSTTTTTTVALLTEPTMVSTPTTVPTITTMATTTALLTTVQLISTTLDNHIREITQRPRGDVHIPRNPGQNVFELDFDDIELGNIADFARDDSAPGALSCSFDQGVCSWMTDGDGDLRWETISDPHGGRYLTVPEPMTGRGFRGARLNIPLTPPNSPSWKDGALCLAFKHRLQGLLVGSLQVFIKKGWGNSPAVWTRASGHGWRHTQLALWGRGIEMVVLKGERRKGRSGEIAIDDVSIHTGVCSNTGRD